MIGAVDHPCRPPTGIGRSRRIDANAFRPNGNGELIADHSTHQFRHFDCQPARGPQQGWLASARYRHFEKVGGVQKVGDESGAWPRIELVRRVDLRDALARYGKPEIFNTDQGSQFTSLDFTGVLKDAGVAISMDGRGRCLDNIFIERLWRSLKYEAIYPHELTDGFAAERVIGEWIAFYNTERPHSVLDGATPAEAYSAGRPVDMMDKARALPMNASGVHAPQGLARRFGRAPQQQKAFNMNRVLAA